MSFSLLLWASYDKDISRGTLPLEIRVRLVQTPLPCIVATLQSSQALSKFSWSWRGSGAGGSVGEFISSDCPRLLVRAYNKWYQLVDRHWPPCHLCDSHRMTTPVPSLFKIFLPEGRLHRESSRHHRRFLQRLSGIPTPRQGSSPGWGKKHLERGEPFPEPTGLGTVYVLKPSGNSS